MALHPPSRGLAAERLAPRDLPEALAWLEREPVLLVYLVALALRDAFARPRDETWVVRRDGAIAAYLHLGGTSGAVLPAGRDPEALEALAEQALARRAALPPRLHVIGPGEAFARVADRFAAAGIRPRVRRRQVYMALDRGALPPFERLPALRRATPEDRALVHESGALLRAEELEEDPRVADPAAYARRVEEECRDGYTWLWTADDGLRFRASVSAITTDAAQVSGVYTPAARRRRGHARRGLSELCARLLERVPAVCLFVNDFNAPAIALYEALGFREISDWGSAFYDPASAARAR